MEGIKRRREFEEALRNIISKLDREGKDRLDRSEVEEIGEQYDLDPEKARELFLASKGDVWEGELIDGEREPGWEAARLDRAPASGDNLSV
jgi:hypothetical protein